MDTDVRALRTLAETYFDAAMKWMPRNLHPYFIRRVL